MGLDRLAEEQAGKRPQTGGLTWAATDVLGWQKNAAY
jgi:hypothetical protein